MSSRPQHILLGALCALAAFGLYAGYDMTIKLLGGDFSPFQILAFAGIATFPLVTLRLMVDGRPLGFRPVLLRWTVVRVVVTIFNGLLGAYAFAVLPLAEAYAIFFLMPLLIAVLAVPILGEPIDWPRGLSVLAGLAGVVLALQPGQSALEWGHLAAFGAASLGAVNYVALRRSGGVENWAVLMLYPMVGQLVVVLAVLPFVYQPMSALQIGLTGAMAVQGFVGALFIIAAYRLAPAIVVAPMQYSQIIWASLAGALFFDERMSLGTMAGIAIIIAAGMVLLWQSNRRPAALSSEVAAQ